MTRKIRLLTAAVGALAAALVAAPAHAGDVDAWNVRLAATTVCVVPDFPVTGSGFRVQQGVANWNAAQDTVRLVMGMTAPGCAVVRVHRYTADDGHCGLADVAEWTGTATAAGQVLYDGVDVYLNTRCSAGRRTIKCASLYLVEHELGHALGLAHDTTPDSATIMGEESGGYSCRKFEGRVGPRDVTRLAAVYAVDAALPAA